MTNARFLPLLAILVAAAGLAGCSDDETNTVTESKSDGGYPSQLDKTFGTKGIVTTSVSYVDDAANAVAIQDDGMIVVAGYVSDGSQTDFLVLRYTEDGELDSTFGTDGKVVVDVGATANDVATSVALAGDGSIYVGGYAFNGSGDADFAVVKLDSSGALDAAFDSDGVAIVDFSGTDDVASAIALQSDGAVVLAGSTKSGSYTNFALARLDGATGALDAAFDSDGRATVSVASGNDAINAIAIQADGGIVAAGSADGASDSDFAVARFTAAGALDTGFDSDGVLTIDLAGDDVATAVALDADANIVVGGRADEDFAVARLTTAGALDTGFNLTGSLVADFGEDYDHASGLAIDSDGEIFVAGYSSVSGNYDFALGMFLPDGSRYRSFGAEGLVTTAVGAGHDLGAAVAVSGSRIVVVGKSYSTQTGNDVAVVAYEK